MNGEHESVRLDSSVDDDHDDGEDDREESQDDEHRRVPLSKLDTCDVICILFLMDIFKGIWLLFGKSLALKYF